MIDLENYGQFYVSVYVKRPNLLNIKYWKQEVFTMFFL